MVLGFTNSKSSVSFKKSQTKSIDTIFVVDGFGLKMIIKKGKLILAEKEYLLDNEIVLDTITFEKTKFIPEGPGALGGELIEYYKNGKVKARSQTKNEFGCWMNSGLFEYFDIQGNVIRTLNYDNWINKGEGCHSAVHDITQKEFYTNGQIKSLKHFQSGYEEGELNPVGEWKFYNEKGKEIRTEKFKRLYIKK